MCLRVCLFVCVVCFDGVCLLFVYVCVWCVYVCDVVCALSLYVCLCALGFGVGV